MQTYADLCADRQNDGINKNKTIEMQRKMNNTNKKRQKNHPKSY